MADPQQELYTRLLIDLRAYFRENGYEVYDGALPPDNTPYPFVYLGDFRQGDTTTKTQVIGTVYPTIHVWHNNVRQRGTLSEMLLGVKYILYGIDKTDSCSWLISNITQSIIPDNTTKTPLLHGVIEANAQFS